MALIALNSLNEKIYKENPEEERFLLTFFFFNDNRRHNEEERGPFCGCQAYFLQEEAGWIPTTQEGTHEKMRQWGNNKTCREGRACVFRGKMAATVGTESS